MIRNYNNEIIEVNIERTNRTTLSISIKDDASVLVKAPMFLSDAKIRELLDKKADWIIEKRNLAKREQKIKIKREYKNGATLPYLGKEYPIEMILAKKSSVELLAGENFSKEDSAYDGKIVIKTSKTEKEDIQKLLKKWYKKQTKEITSKRIAYYSSIINVTVTSIDIKSRKKEWGSCDNHGNITFNWKLGMAKPEAIDYVVVHELCHRKYMDHSKQFWKEVGKYIPDYKERQNWLRENAVNMNIE